MRARVTPEEGSTVARPRSWSDDDLREAVASARSWREVRRLLGLTGGGSTNKRLRGRAGELGLDITHLPRPGEAPRRFTDDELVAAVAASSSLNGVFDRLGLAVGGSAWRRMQEHIVRLGLDTSHWRAVGVRPGLGPAVRHPRPDLTEEELRRAVAGSRSLAASMRALGLDPSSGSTFAWFKCRLLAAGVSIEHLAGQRWAAGERRTTTRRRPLEEVLVAGSPTGAAARAFGVA